MDSATVASGAGLPESTQGGRVTNSAYLLTIRLTRISIAILIPVVAVFLFSIRSQPVHPTVVKSEVKHADRPIEVAIDGEEFRLRERELATVTFPSRFVFEQKEIMEFRTDIEAFGSTPVVIEHVGTGCGCVKAQLSGKWIEPKGTVAVTLQKQATSLLSARHLSADATLTFANDSRLRLVFPIESYNRIQTAHSLEVAVSHLDCGDVQPKRAADGDEVLGQASFYLISLSEVDLAQWNCSAGKPEQSPLHGLNWKVERTDSPMGKFPRQFGGETLYGAEYIVSFRVSESDFHHRLVHLPLIVEREGISDVPLLAATLCCEQPYRFYPEKLFARSGGQCAVVIRSSGGRDFSVETVESSDPRIRVHANLPDKLRSMASVHRISLAVDALSGDDDSSTGHVNGEVHIRLDTGVILHVPIFVL